MATRRAAILFMLVLLACLANGYWFALGRPVPLVDSTAQRIACVSYAPYRIPGETPFDAHFVVSAARIDTDLAALSRRFGCVRTYSVSAGLDQVPAIAKKYGMTVYLGMWLSRNPVDNERELAHGIEVALANREQIRALVVGNEVLLRGELPEETIAADVERVKAATGLPVTYADVWEFWLKYPKVGRAVSFVTIHILPYWEDEPVAIEDAVAHVRAIHEKMQKAFPDRDILIGESGWPSEGRQRWGAIPSRVNQARFAREFLNWAEPAGVHYNLIEAFDQPWKRLLEGTVGGYWGLYDRELNEKFPMHGPVIEEPRWRAGIVAGLLLGGLALLVGIVRRWPMPALCALAIAGDAIGATLFAEWRHMGFANRDLTESGLTHALLALAFITAFVQAAELARWIARRAPAAQPVCLAQIRWRGRAPGTFAADALGVLRFVWLFCMAVMNLLLVFDARYRDFPIELFAAPIAGFALLALAEEVPLRTVIVAIEEQLLAYWALAGGVIVIIMERPSNTAADAWVTLGFLLAAATLAHSIKRPRSWRRAAR